ncbi:phosphoacetylglucosamine mutase [Babesia ovata]|uniref:Phosphoacetylglucosamine mutase n=1 Tax=Babesia ovata TaxID=189622 RepID=A0A2H6KGC3_9APIC|nr:phosphoacetylglucosamine mutase [Babesia ovata]GBE62050.1 phosphoacetylglucosamine mutase [Babesia ovata]
MPNAGGLPAAGGDAEEVICIRQGPDIPQGYVDLDYGTSGFRGVADTPPNHLDHVVYRCGALLAALPFLRNPTELYNVELSLAGPLSGVLEARSMPIQSAGAVITASHNHAKENGIKLLEADGTMLETIWEKEFTALVNFRGSVSDALARIFRKHGVVHVQRNRVPYTILVGHDTRESSPKLAAIFKAGVEAMADALKLEKITCVVLGAVTTPTVGFLLNNSLLSASNDDMYVEALRRAFYSTLDSLVALGRIKRSLKTDDHQSLFYDCSYGVGGKVVYKLFACLREIAIIPHLCHSPIWLGEQMHHMLNNECGANYVLSEQRPPALIESRITVYEGKWFCSFDGDVDRLVYFSPHKGSIRLIDGVRLLLIKMKFLNFALSNWKRESHEVIKMGVLLNHYANGAALNYIRQLMAEWNEADHRVHWSMQLCKVGMKNMQAKVPNYHITILYEANGHGNVVFTKDSPLYRDNGDCEYRRLLMNVSAMFNNPIGDAIANSLFIELALRTLELSYDDVLQFYEELPYVNVSARIPPEKRAIFRTTPDDDSVIEEPAELMRLVTESVAKVKGARAFIRPSGTEALCRIYSEAPSEEQARALANVIVEHMKSFL